ncbi:lysozyme family protein [Alkalibacterium sp. 20]|uniref:lysozyme family protein n=1 Tax=Alkalibacterium sp. 20 TaxID=1798803 RepID=UPI000900255B|nr:lysozyme family protein [Alkalibacterium sp. 20]OJF96180.1 hypothetical protein AX762_05455 [Alkalibacterium sp. 20]
MKTLLDLFKKYKKLKWVFGTFSFLILIVGLILVFSIIFMSFNDNSTTNNSDFSGNVGLSENVLAWEETVSVYANKYEIADQVPLILALIQVESGGVGKDIMQSSESLGLPVNTLDPIDSIDQGVKYLSQQLISSKALGVDTWTAIQGYNFGSAYMNHVAENGGKHTIEIAMKYSKNVVAPSLGNTTGQTYAYNNAVANNHGNFLYANGGNFFYVNLVQQFLSTGGTGDEELKFPVDDTNVTSPFGFRIHPIFGMGKLHGGIDFAPLSGGNPPIYASLDGTVVTAAYHSSYGNYIQLDHGNGLQTLYAHLSTMHVKKETTVTTGQQIGTMGTTGSSTGVHLHYEVQVDGQRKDPAIYLGL